MNYKLGPLDLTVIQLLFGFAWGCHSVLDTESKLGEGIPPIAPIFAFGI